MDAEISAIINGMDIQEINRIVKELDLPKNSSIDDVIAKTCEFMRNRVLTKLFILEFNKYMSFSIIVSKTPVRGFYNLIKEYLKIVRDIRVEEAGPILREFMSYDASAIEHYGHHFIRSTCDTVRNVQESRYDDLDTDDSDMEDFYNIDLYKRLKKRNSDGSFHVDTVPFVKNAIGIASVISKNNLCGYPVFGWNVYAPQATAFLHYLETKVDGYMQ
ncbi:putative tlr signaling inhibitor [Skunkpox virus]|uniref:Putative tlr signaling inhibitor n=1 Tax=Skunkpox virus TaxID=160796 RepID=A0A1C9KBZ7_9POXV|nr:putative tlr signaling inhibitor [Skunkpox virus]AOP31685.1 putative tlr signaling inhibitor [Skunkpox virus]